MPRAIWKGSLSFGLVNIPVEVHTAVHDHRPRFHLLHARDKSPIKLLRVRARDQQPVAWDDLVKGYEYSRGQFVVLTKEDFASAALEKTRRVDILDFVRAQEIDDRFFETPYYLVPAKGGEHAYDLLREAMRSTDRIGIAKFMLRDTMHLAAIEVINEALVLTLMRFGDELVDIKSLQLPPKADLRKPELDLAKALVENLAAAWAPEKYTDDYRDNLMRIIKAKAKGRRFAPVETPVHRKAGVVDLMERLRQSLQHAQGGARPDARSARPARPPRKPRAAARSKKPRRTVRTRAASRS